MNDIKSNCVVVIGAGLSGLTVSHTIIEAGGSVVLLEKSESIFPPTSNSSFSNSGINGCNSGIQRTHNSGDSFEEFLSDITKTGTKKSDLLETLCCESGKSVDWLTSTFGLSFTLSRSGGHSHARTHKIKDHPTGLAIVSNMAQKALELAEAKPDKMRIVTGAAASQLVISDRHEVIGVMYEKQGTIESVHGRVVICTGGFGADFKSVNSTIARYRPDLVNLCTACNLETSSGDGIRLAEQAGAKLVDMMYVQVNPTGLVDPKDPQNRFKTTASESLRGDGGIILNGLGKRFVNEIAKRDFLSSELMRREGPFYMVINSRITRHVKNYIEEYMKSGLMTACQSGLELAAAIGVSPEILASTFEEYNIAAVEEKDVFGKAHFRNVPFEITDSFCVAQIQPVIHYCAGGVTISTDARVIGREGKPISGLYAAGEVTGGVHGASPFTGNDLLDCVVFGRIAAVSAAKDTYGEAFVEQHMNPEIVKANLLSAISLEKERIQKEKDRKYDLEREIEECENRLVSERQEIGELCSKLREQFGHLNPQLAGLVFDPAPGKSLEETLSVASVKELSLELRSNRKRLDGELLALKEQTAQDRARIEEIDREKESHKKRMKEIGAEKKTLEKQLEDLRNSSALIREIHQLEEAVATFKQRQEKAERAQESLVKEHALKRKQVREELTEINTKREEVEVMMGLDKVEQRKELEQLRVLLESMKKKMAFEKNFAQRAHDLAANQQCPIFQRPLKKRMHFCPQINGA